MDDGQHADARAHKKQRRASFEVGMSTHHHQPTMKQSQILTPLLTPLLTPPRSPHSSISTTPRRKSIHSGSPASRVHFDLHMSVHRSASICTSLTDMSESSLWTLPGIEDGESTRDLKATLTTPATENRWSRLLRGAASSNRERHRARLEGDGWAFVGGRYSDELQELSDESGESVDEEFDVVVLPRECVGC